MRQHWKRRINVENVQRACPEASARYVRTSPNLSSLFPLMAEAILGALPLVDITPRRPSPLPAYAPYPEEADPFLGARPLDCLTVFL